MQLTRRQLIQTGIAGGLVLGFGRLAWGPVGAEPVYTVPDVKAFKVLDAKSRTAFAAIASVMLEGALPREAASREAALLSVVQGCDTVIAALPGMVQDEIQELLQILNNPFSRRWVAGVMSPWAQATPTEVTNFLNRWRYASLILLRSGYQALHQIVFAAWYGNPAAWVGIGYEGPPEFMKGYWNHA
jgi:hypothetical protein